ncbi:hypothetical protein MLD38_036681 [Melastoma candidum]|uniref:Uncharacterized protein n=1 Tax=Melastoma candidum TaxID=119954 RepID=A0ACB9LLM6_9MYRT|nr:hypothetical protein MLD38_036681 [Melastoma candidum]
MLDGVGEGADVDITIVHVANALVIYGDPNQADPQADLICKNSPQIKQTHRKTLIRVGGFSEVGGFGEGKGQAKQNAKAKAKESDRNQRHRRK